MMIQHTRNDGEADNKTLAKTTKACRVFWFVCRFAFIAIALWTIAVLALTVISVFDSPNSFDSISSTFATIFLYALYGISACLLPALLGRMLHEISVHRTPFTLSNVRRLRLIGFDLVAYCILGTLLSYADSQLASTLKSGSIQVGDFVRDFASNAGTTFDLFPIIIAVMFFALSYVFKYGVLLQQESDETL